MSQSLEQHLTPDSSNCEKDMKHHSQSLIFAGLTLKEYFERTSQVDKLNKIEEEQESESELQYKIKGEIQRKTNRKLKSLTRLKEYELELEKTMVHKIKGPKKLSPNKKISFNTDQSQHYSKLPSIHHQSFSPQIKNLKLEVMSKFRQHYRTKTEAEDIVLNQAGLNNKVMLKKRNNQSILIHITKKKVSSVQPKIQTSTNRAAEAEKEVDGFMMTFSKIRERKHSDFSLMDLNKKTKRY